jgi:hypothetical protein
MAWRRSQNWIGAPGATLRTAAFVPPPAHEVVGAMGAPVRQSHIEQVSHRHRAPANLLRLIDLLFRQPVVTVGYVEERLGVLYTTANGLVRRLVELGLLAESTGQRRNRRFAYRAYLELFEPTSSAG